MKSGGFALQKMTDTVYSICVSTEALISQPQEACADLLTHKEGQIRRRGERT